MRWELIYIALWSQFKVQGFSRQEPFSSSLWEELNVNKYWWSRTNFADELPQFYFTSVIAVIYTNIRTVRMYVCMWIIIFRPSVRLSVTRTSIFRLSVRLSVTKTCIFCPSVRLSVTKTSIFRPSVSYKVCLKSTSHDFPSVCPSVSYKDQHFPSVSYVDQH